MAVSELMLDMVKGRRNYFIEKVKQPIVRGLVTLSIKSSWLRCAITFISIIRSLRKYPKPSGENIRRPNALVLLEIWDEFLSFDTMYGRWDLWEILKRVSVDQYEHSNNYAQRIDWFVEKLAKAYLDGRWQPSHPWCPFMYWNDPITQDALFEARQKVVQGKLARGIHITSGEILAKESL